MSETVVSSCFGRDHATAYDARWAKLAPLRDALDLLVRVVLQDLPGDARILCVGAGTGAELLALARAFPGWRFTAVDPAAPMLEVCRRKVDEAGIASRCELHEGYLDSLPHGEPFDAATSILVSQFLVDPERRRAFFRGIAERLRPGGTLISADLASALDPAARERQLEIWLRAHDGPSMERAREACASWGKLVAVSPPQELEALIASAGFERPILFYQALFIHAWYARARAQAG